MPVSLIVRLVVGGGAAVGWWCCMVLVDGGMVVVGGADGWLLRAMVFCVGVWKQFVFSIKS